MILAMTKDLGADSALTADYLWGADEIGTYLGMSARQVRYAEQKGELPIGRLSGKLYASKRQLDTFLMNRAAIGSCEAADGRD